MSNMLALEQPKLRFKKFGDVWNKNILNDICTKVKLKNKSNLHSIVLTNSAQYGVIKQTDFFDKDIADQNNLSGYFVVKKDDFVYNPRISELAPVGPLNRNNLETGVMSPLYTVFSFQKVRLDFIEYYFKAPKWHKYMYLFSNVGARSDRMSISQSDFMNMPIFLPNMIEQKKIASFLSSVDKKIELLTKKHELLEKYKKGLMQKIFSQEIRFKQDDGSDYPDWEESFLEKKIFLQSGFPFKSKYYNGSDKKVLRIGDVKKNIRCELFKGIFTNEACEDKYKVNENDFVIALSGATFGKIGKVKDQEEYFINQRVAAVRTKENLEFFFQLFDSEPFKKYLLSVPSIGAQPNISNDDIYKFSYFFPTVKEQQKIASFLSSVDKKIELIQQQIEKNQTFKKGLLQQMFI